MDGDVESIVSSMPIISEEPENSSTELSRCETKLSSTDSIRAISTNSHIVATVKATEESIISSDQDILSLSKDDSVHHIISEEGAQIITTNGHHIITSDQSVDSQSGKIISNGTTQIIKTSDGSYITHESGELIAANTEQIFSDETDAIIAHENDIAMDDEGNITTDVRGNILHGSQVIAENGKAHFISTSGEMISVDSLLSDHRIQEHSINEVIEENADEEASLDTRENMIQKIKKEPVADDAETSAIQIRVNASSPRKKDHIETIHEDELLDENTSDGMADKNSKYVKVDRDDPRSRLHFVKYMKREGKTIKIWECGICGKEFMHQYTLMRHLPTHTDERNFRCNQCGKAFRQMSTLSQHKATHSESRPYVCDLCQKTFSRVSTLISHKKTHTEEKQHRCHVCGKAFHQKGNLKNHLFTHTNERPYKCDICGRGFNQSSNLQCHRAKSHADGSLNYQYMADKYKCNYCDLAFARRAQLRQHEEYKHGVRSLQGSRVMSNSGARIMGSNNTSLLKKRKIGNVRIIQLPNGDRTFQEIESGNDPSRQKRIRQKSSSKSGILIEPIDTRAMHRALAAGRTPFALLKPAKGVPVVVKVQFAMGSKHMLVPANADELRQAGKFTVSIQQEGTKAVQIKVPVVATVIQRIDDDGQIHMDIEAPAEDEEMLDTLALSSLTQSSTAIVQGDLTVSQKSHIETSSGNMESITQETTSTHTQLVMPAGIVHQAVASPVMAEEEEPGMSTTMLTAEHTNITMAPDAITDVPGSSENIDYSISHESNEEAAGEGINSVDLLATAVNLVSQAHVGMKGEIDGMEEEGIQYLRQMNMGEYEVVPPDDAQATHIMNQHGHIQQIKMVDEANTMTMDQANISALMDALQNAGYQLGGGNQQIIINADGNACVVDDQVCLIKTE
ncbi:unnamed protein product [Meganyctiphanes norvegica]|uniref:C2H2-type domain-containing protein n=1 Tax=Meganyctiphanes norvegica TaxID=48144 RepID=A0AAV2SS05_MEGNR